ncbi:ABC transporter ATP-binding protein [Kosmotoga pacifica]|uniref:Amino acid ABC transporter ATPase n=1 Tax=Kosmotoga pacifica TaxID=1330330 RepID=A0A0G2Z7Y1_9BACT|nr:ABC transporter ATP-binding protein [Kosmotoga pacifica]AKI97710.1 amino acid ABC transporter ATPase [Kosmotoga pacifica]
MSQNDDVILKIEGLKVNYGAIKAIKGIDLQVPKGKIVTMIGANGAGKTTTLSVISGLVKAASGKIFFEGTDITNHNPHVINKMGISLVPEGRRVFSNLTVRENLLMGAYNRKGDSVEEDLEWVFELFPRLKERINQLANTLSGGEQQMLAVSRALMSRPKLMMMDEPSLGLAPMLVKEVFEVIQKINGEGTTILLIEQDAAVALKTSHYGYVLETGRITLHGPSQELLQNDEVRKAYLGL